MFRARWKDEHRAGYDRFLKSPRRPEKIARPIRDAETAGLRFGG